MLQVLSYFIPPFISSIMHEILVNNKIIFKNYFLYYRIYLIINNLVVLFLAFFMPLNLFIHLELVEIDFNFNLVWISVFISLIMPYIVSIIKKIFKISVKINNDAKTKDKKKFSLYYVFFYLGYILVFFNLILIFVKGWIEKNIGLVSIQEILFHIKVPLKGTSNDIVSSIVVNCIIPSIIIIIFILINLQYEGKKDIIISLKTKKNFKLINWMKNIILIINIIFFIFLYFYYDKTFGITSYIKYQNMESSFIEENYIDPRSVQLEFPEEKRNLIYIFLESMETTYLDDKSGGIQDKNLIPELAKIANENINFSNTNRLGGAYQLPNTEWTIAAMVAHTAGINLKIPIDRNAYFGYNQFLPGAYSIGDILNENGYNQMLMVGSDSNFGGRKNYFESHGNYIIRDLFSARNAGIVEQSHNVFWGLEDSYLFEFAKQQLKILSKKDKPFNFTLLTVSTHFPNGYLEDSCDEIYDNQYANVINCSSKQVSDFIEWIKEQDFYENTTIVLVGDHLTMASNEIIKKGYDRTIFNIFINSAIKEENTKNRLFSTMDFYPTTLASLGVKIEGNKLGLGTNLYSNELTIIEKYGLEYVQTELLKKSPFYEEEILYKGIDK